MLMVALLHLRRPNHLVQLGHLEQDPLLAWPTITLDPAGPEQAVEGGLANPITSCRLGKRNELRPGRRHLTLILAISVQLRQIRPSSSFKLCQNLATP